MILTLVLFALISCAGLLIQSVVGFAGSLFAIPLFCLFMSPHEAVPAYSMVMLVVDLFLVYECRKAIRWTHLRGILAGGLTGVPIGAYCLKHLPLQWIGITISVVTLTFAVLFMLNVTFAIRERAHTQFGIGLLSGMLGGSISQSGPPVVIYALALGWRKDTFRSTLLAYFTCLAVMANTCYWLYGMVSTRSVAAFAAGVVPATAAATLGIRFKNSVGETAFRRIVLFVIMAVSVVGLLRHLYQ